MERGPDVRRQSVKDHTYHEQLRRPFALLSQLEIDLLQLSLQCCNLVLAVSLGPLRSVQLPPQTSYGLLLHTCPSLSAFLP